MNDFLIWTRQNNVKMFGKCCLEQSDRQTDIKHKTSKTEMTASVQENKSK